MNDIQKVLDALTSPIRREILWLIWDDELAAGVIASAFKVTAPTISEHLAVLRDADLVTVQVDGSFRRYRAKQDVLHGLQQLVFSERKWVSADNMPERKHASATTGLVVRVSVDLDIDRATAFRAFIDPELFSMWLGVPVSRGEHMFSLQMEWGLRVRGTYEIVSTPSLIALRWDSDLDQVPVPGSGLDAYLRFAELPGGARVEVHQLVDNADQAGFMENAWSTVFGRLREGLLAALEHPDTMAPRPERPTIIGGR